MEEKNGDTSLCRHHLGGIQAGHQVRTGFDLNGGTFLFEPNVDRVAIAMAEIRQGAARYGHAWLPHNTVYGAAVIASN